MDRPSSARSKVAPERGGQACEAGGVGADAEIARRAAGHIWAAVLTRLKDSPLFSSSDDVAADGCALMRTGWLRSTSGYGFLGTVPTPRFDFVTRMVDFNDPDVVAP